MQDEDIVHQLVASIYAWSIIEKNAFFLHKPVALVNMTKYVNFWTNLGHKIQKTTTSSSLFVINFIQNTERRPMSNQDVYLPFILINNLSSLLWGKIKIPIEVSRASRNSQNPNALHFH